MASTSQKQHPALRKLIKRRNTLLENLVDDEAQEKISDHPADFISSSALAGIQGISLALRDKQLKTLKDIELAIKRVGNGVYGTCVECEEAIFPRRLDAFPEVSLCLACQEASEATEKNEIFEPCPDVDMGEDFSIASMMEQNLAL